MHTSGKNRRITDLSAILEGLVKADIEFIRVLDLKMLIELKKCSKDPKEKQRLLVLEETLRQLTKHPDIEE
jgi:hypothetical protein